VSTPEFGDEVSSLVHGLLSLLVHSQADTKKHMCSVAQFQIARIVDIARHRAKQNCKLLVIPIDTIMFLIFYYQFKLGRQN
jgi:hypothetical protein